MTTSRTTHWGIHPLLPRDPAEPHRAASPIEALFDLVFVVAVSVSSAALHELELDGHLLVAISAYLAVFFAIWWAWMNVTWFATSFDTDDWLYRLAIIVQMAGALVIAAGARAGIIDGDFTWVVVGYVLLRLVSVPQWIRVAIANPDYRRTATTYSVGITVLQILWIIRQPLLPEQLQIPSFVVMVALELALPLLAERQKATPWHPHHITERYGLFTIIVLGESILASANAILEALNGSEDPVHFVAIAGLALSIVAAMWWTYFSCPMHAKIGSLRSTMSFAYFHYVIFASAGAFSAGVEVAVAMAGGHDVAVDAVAGRATLTVPVALFLLSVWWLALRQAQPRWGNVVIVVLSAVIGLSAAWPASMLITAIAAIAIVVVLEFTKSQVAARRG